MRPPKSDLDISVVDRNCRNDATGSCWEVWQRCVFVKANKANYRSFCEPKSVVNAKSKLFICMSTGNLLLFVSTNSGDKIPSLDHIQTITWPYTYRHLILYIPSLDHIHTVTCPYTYRHLTIYIPSLDHKLTVTWPYKYLHLTIYIPSLDHIHTVTWPYIYRHLIIYIPSLDHIHVVIWPYTYRHLNMYALNKII